MHGEAIWEFTISKSTGGDVSFNAAELLTIISLFGAYAQSYDAGKLDEFLPVFTDEVEHKFMNGDKVTVDWLAQVTPAMAERVKPSRLLRCSAGML